MTSALIELIIKKKFMGNISESQHRGAHEYSGLSGNKTNSYINYSVHFH